MTTAVPVLLAAAAAAVATAPLGSGARLGGLVAKDARTSSWRVIGTVLLGGAAFAVSGVPAAVLAGVAGHLVVRAARARHGAAEVERERACTLDALSLLAADLRAGREPGRALTAAAQVASGAAAVALADAGAAVRLGGNVVAALTVDGSPVAPSLRALGACWQVCSEAGSGLASAVERLEEGLRAAQAQRLSVAAELAAPRATAQLLAVLPVVGVALAAGLGAHPVAMLLRTPLGLGCLVTGLLLDGVGVLWTRRLTERALS